jgi:nucleoside-diphosphate-sugar epimerase
MKLRALLTGASGFVGKAIFEHLVEEGVDVVVAARIPSGDARGRSRSVYFDLERPDQLTPAAMEGIDVVVHAAARVHVMRPTPDEEQRAFLCNVDATRALAEAAATAGARRFVFVSSIKVYGGLATAAPLRVSDLAVPTDAYGRSKLRAEDVLRQVEATTGLEVVIIRPPLVYGPGVRANFLKLMMLIDRGMPLPLRSVDNRRSLVAVQNLADLVRVTMSHPTAAGRTFLVSDNDDLSTPELIRKLCSAFGRSSRMWPCPDFMLRLAGRALGREAEISRLVDSLQVDPSATMNCLGWSPPMGVERALELTTDWYRTREQLNV